MSKLFFPVMICLLLFYGVKLPAQNLRFKTVLENSSTIFFDMKQDKLGFFWFNNAVIGLQRYDGIKFKSYLNDPGNPNSKAPGQVQGLFIDAENIIWLGTDSSGLERLDPANNTFTHFRHNAKDTFSLSSDKVRAVLEDHAGNLWVGTNQGLDLLDRKTGKFTHYRNDPNDRASISYPRVSIIYEDRKGVIWIYGKSISVEYKSPGSLNCFDPASGKFTPYFQDSATSNNSIPGKVINDIYEDSKNNFWIGTDAGLYTMDRNTGKCTRYFPDPFHSSTLSQTPVAEKIASEIAFITEDSSGALCVGMAYAGMNRYDPVTKKSMHFGIIQDFKDMSFKARDTATGLNIPFIYRGISSNDGLFWVCGFGGISQLNYQKTSFPFYNISKTAAALYLEANGKILWIGTDTGLLRRDLTTQIEKLFINEPKNNNSNGDNFIYSIAADEKGNLWLGTKKGLNKFDPVTEKYVQYKNDPENPSSIFDNTIYDLFFDHNKNLWGAGVAGISRMDRTTGQITNYTTRQIDSTYKNFEVNRIAEDPQHDIWFTANYGVYKLDTKTGKFRKYINDDLRSICIDAKGRVWTGGFRGLYALNKTKDKFELFANEDSAVNISGVVNIIEDDQKNLWVSASSAIIKINEDRIKIKKYGEDNGVGRNQGLWSCNSLKAADGRLFLGIGDGYYSFYPDQLSDNNIAPQLNITGFKLGDKLINAENGGLLTLPIWQTKEIRLSHDQNVFSFNFFVVDYINPRDKKYSFMLENYDNAWHDIGSDYLASFFSIPPGSYIFHVKAVTGDGGIAEKSIRIIISPPWWKTWWAYCLYALLIIVAVYLSYKYQKYYIVKKEQERIKEKEFAQAKEIEKAYTQLETAHEDLKSTQAQLIHSEKMASLGELTAGIAHEIQNPLNFVNNFSEVNKELLIEMKSEIEKGNLAEVKLMANDLIDNEDKISLHGKRADAIVKSMLQHSQSSTGTKEPTDINALADEYLRLAYHGLRAKDKSFNASIKTDYDPSVGLINVIPQDISRVLLNLYNNAFYAVTEKAKNQTPGYEPTVIVCTKKKSEKIEINIMDNGLGMPDAVKEKIFQPFFTTKPTGQGTGLGLSLSYDIVKTHGGELKVETREGEGSTFIVSLPGK